MEVIFADILLILGQPAWQNCLSETKFNISYNDQ